MIRLERRPGEECHRCGDICGPVSVIACARYEKKNVYLCTSCLENLAYHRSHGTDWAPAYLAYALYCLRQAADSREPYLPGIIREPSII